jgi:hypothetical protein
MQYRPPVESREALGRPPRGVFQGCPHSRSYGCGQLLFSPKLVCARSERNFNQLESTFNHRGDLSNPHSLAQGKEKVSQTDLKSQPPTKPSFSLLALPR